MCLRLLYVCLNILFRIPHKDVRSLFLQVVRIVKIDTNFLQLLVGLVNQTMFHLASYGPPFSYLAIVGCK